MSRGAGAGKHLHNVSWLWRAPRRALCAARDLYVRSLTGCAGHLPADAAFGYPSFAATPAGFRADSFASSRRSSSYSGAGDDEDLRELIRAASQRRAAEAAAAERHPAAVPRSHSVAMARIDEDAPCEFGGCAAAAVFPRSRSYAVGTGRRGRVAAA
ncbi:unnamed protein product [Urochloa humidicola]